MSTKYCKTVPPFIDVALSDNKRHSMVARQGTQFVISYFYYVSLMLPNTVTTVSPACNDHHFGTRQNYSHREMGFLESKNVIFEQIKTFFKTNSILKFEIITMSKAFFILSVYLTSFDCDIENVLKYSFCWLMVRHPG